MTSPHLIGGDIASTLLMAQKEWGNMRGLHVAKEKWRAIWKRNC